MKKIIVEKPFSIFLVNNGGDDLQEGILHWVEFDPEDSRHETVGNICFSFNNSKTLKEAVHCIWGSAEDDPEDFSDCYICMPTELEYDEEDELENISLSEMMQGLLTVEELGIKEM